MLVTALMELDVQLDAEDTDVVLAAVWEAFGVTAALCHRIAFDEGSGELQAMMPTLGLCTACAMGQGSPNAAPGPRSACAPRDLRRRSARYPGYWGPR